MAIRVLAIDWSGAVAGGAQKIWLAEVRDGRLVRLQNGRNREQIAEHLIAEAERDPQMVIGLDFAFSLPEWFLEQRGLTNTQALWRLAADQADRWLAACEPPFWGRSTPRPDLPEHFRRTEREVPATAGIRPKSVFQIGGAGAVGTASLRGMRLLHRLHEAGFSIWPFDPSGWPLVVEIYPRLLTGAVVKSNADARAAYLDSRYPVLDAALLRLSASSEDAFDAAVSALVMAEHLNELVDLPSVTDRQTVLEGVIWCPGPHSLSAKPRSPAITKEERQQSRNPEADLITLIREGESEQVEFKKSLAVRDDALETLAAFASQHGGIIVFGVSPQGKPVGVDIGPNTIEGLVGAIKAKISPPIYPNVRKESVEDKVVLTVRIEPTGRLHMCEGRFYIRVGNATLPSDYEEYSRRFAERQARSAPPDPLPDLSLELRREPEIAADGISPSFVVSLGVNNRPGAALADWWSFQLELPFAPPRFSEPIGTNRLLRPVLGRERQDREWKHWLPFTNDGESWIRFRSEGTVRLPGGGSEILGQFLLRVGWYGFDFKDGRLLPSPGAEPVPADYSCRYDLTSEAGPTRSGTLSLPLYKLLPGRF